MQREEFKIERVAERILPAGVGVARGTPMQERHVIGFLERIAEQLPVAPQLGAPLVASRAVGGEGIPLQRVGPLA
jgi:hypothetical protein